MGENSFFMSVKKGLFLTRWKRCEPMWLAGIIFSHFLFFCDSAVRGRAFSTPLSFQVLNQTLFHLTNTVLSQYSTIQAFLTNWNNKIV